jgi:hypothetical protein
MRLLQTGLLLNFIIAVFLGNTNRVKAAQRYIIVHPKTKDPLELIGATHTTDLTNIFATDNASWCTVTLTETQAQNLTSVLYDGIVVPDAPIQLPFEGTSTNALRGNVTVRSTNNIFLNDYPNCQAHVDNVDICYLDTVLYSNAESFEGFTVVNAKSYVDDGTPIPCHAHGSQGLSLILGRNNGVIRSGNIRVFGIGIFDCNGQGYVSNMISGFQDALNHENKLQIDAQNGLPLRRTIINLSGVAGSNSALDAAVAAVARKIPIFTAAGNSAKNACDSQSPVKTTGVFGVGATTIPGDQPALFTNYGEPCVKIYLPGSPVTAINPLTGKAIPVSGTSFATPLATAQGAMEIAAQLQATPNQIYANILNRTTIVQTPGSFIGSQMLILSAANACPKAWILQAYTTTRNDNNKFNLWNNIVASSRALCITFEARFRTKKGCVTIGLRQNSNANHTVIKIGCYLARQRFSHTITTSNAKRTTTTKKKNCKWSKF